MKFSNTYFKQVSESKMQSAQNSQRKSIKSSSQQIGAEKINNNEIKENNETNINQNEQISTSSRKKYDAVAAESLATQVNQCQGIKDLEVITLQNDDKIIIFEDSDGSESKKSDHQKENQEIELIQMSQSENLTTSKDSKRIELESKIQNIPAFEILFPATMKLIDLPSIQKIRSEINTARQGQLQQREDISEQSTAKGENSKSNRQQIHQFRKQECNFYLKSCQSSFREREISQENAIPSLTNQKSIECIKIDSLKPPDYEVLVVQSQDVQQQQVIENINQHENSSDNQVNPKNKENTNVQGQQENKNTPEQVQKIKEEEEQNCLICFEKSQDSVFMNCGHGGICYDCSLDIWKITGECYLCREKIQQILQIDLEFKKKNNLVKILYITELKQNSESESDSDNESEESD